MTVLERFLQYVEQNPDSIEDFNSIASKIGVSKPHLRHVIYSANAKGTIEIVKPTLKKHIKVKNK